jgi:hypothetical protein
MCSIVHQDIDWPKGLFDPIEQLDGTVRISQIHLPASSANTACPNCSQGFIAALPELRLIECRSRRENLTISRRGRTDLTRL